VRRNGRLQPAREVGSRKARTLLALLAVERGRVVALDRIGEVLWGDFPPREPADNVATLVSRLRAVLGPDVVAGGRAGYRLGDPVGVDLADAAAMVAEAEARLSGGEPALALTATAAALDLLRGGAVLADEAWAGRARDQQAELLRRAWHAAGEAGLRSGDHPAARSAAEAAVTADPLDEVAYRILMRAHAATGEPARALLGYERLRAVLARELGVDPAPATRDLHLAILRAETPAPATLAPVSPRPAPLPGPGAGPGAGRGGTAGLRPAPSAGLAGRDPDVARLAETWAAAAAGHHPRLLLITGEAGIGKTRLADEVVRLARATGGVVAQARCYEAERSLFLQPVVEALTQLVTGLPAAALKEAAGARAGTLAALVPEAATVLAAAPAEHGSAEAERRRAYDAVAGFLRRFSAGRPVLLVLDDLHHAGDATVELLHYLPRHAAGGRLLVVATLRAEEGEPVRRALAEVAERLDLGPLDTRAIARLATAAGQDAMVGEIARRTRGHTLFVVETLRGLAAGESGVPESLRDSVLARVRRAGGTAEELLRAAAVLGPSFAPPVVAGLLDIGTQEAARRCERILPTRLVVEAGRAYEFANDLIQEVLYETTPVPTRTAYHRRAADLLSENPEAVGRHAEAAQDWARAARGWLAAGERATRGHAVDDAEALLDRALAAARQVRDVELEGRALLARGHARERAFRFEEALADHEAAARVAHAAGDQRLEMRALRELGGPAWAGVGRPVAEGAAHLMEGLRLATALGDRGAESELLGWLAVVSANQLRFDRALDQGHRALAAARATGDDRARAAALDGLKSAYAYLGEIDLLRGILDELEPLLRRLGDLWLTGWCLFESAFPLIGVGAWDDATARVRDALAVQRRSGYTGYEGWYVAHLGWLARLAGRPDEAVALGREALAMESHAWWSAAVPTMLAETLLELGGTAEAVALLEQSLASCDRHRTRSYRLRCLAPLAFATGSPALLDEADAMVRSIGAPPGSAWLYGAEAYVAVARAWLARGETGRAREILAPLLVASERTGWVAPLAAARQADALCRAALASPPA